MYIVPPLTDICLPKDSENFSYISLVREYPIFTKKFRNQRNRILVKYMQLMKTVSCVFKPGVLKTKQSGNPNQNCTSLILLTFPFLINVLILSERSAQFLTLFGISMSSLPMSSPLWYPIIRSKAGLTYCQTRRAHF